MSDIQIAGFEILGKLGEGGMASVWKARQLSLDRIVAIKILSPNFASTPEDIEMFQKEAQQAAKLKHLGIVQVYDANAENGNYFFVMEYVAGYTVGTWLERKGFLSEQDCLLVAECVADALEYAWNNSNIIHCDIKPDNVMIDDDGTVKVTDLGLARTISAMADEDDVDDVMGTPQYISPEQAMGRPDIDYHADIYSLGAMLYHLATGTLMFHDHPDENVMELQVNSSVPDALDVNPELSVPFCFLLEKMLAKNPEDRAADWEEIREDVSRVKKNRMPVRCLSEGALSSMQRSPNRIEPVEVEEDDLSVSLTSESSKFPVIPLVAAVCVFLLIGLGMIFILKGKGDKPAQGGSRQVSSGNQPVSSEADVRKKNVATMEMYEFAIKWIADNPNSYEDGIEKLQAVAKQTRGTKYSLMASEKAKNLEIAWNKQLTKVMKDLENESQYYLNNNEVLYAADLYEKYSGPFADDTRELRMKKAQELRDKKKREDAFLVAEKKRCEAKYEEKLNSVADALKGEGLESASDIIKSCLYDGDLKSRKGDFESLQACVQGALQIDDRILNSIKEQKGQTIVLCLANGSKKVIIDDVKENVIMTRQQYGSTRVLMSVPVKLSELSVKERLSRMGDDSLPEVALVKGLMALKSGSIPYAKTYFAKTHPLIAERLTLGLGSVVANGVTADAKNDLFNGLVALGIKVEPDFDEWLWVAAVDEANMSALMAAKAAVFAKSYKQKYASTGFVQKVEPILELLLNKSKATVESAPLSSDRAVVATPSRLDANNLATIGGEADLFTEDELLAEIMRCNPEIAADDVKIFSDSDGRIHKIQIVSQFMRDISVLAKCKSLTELRCSSVKEWHRANERRIAPLEDITPLSDLPLRKLYLGGTSVKDVSCLARLNLIAIDLHQTKVSSIEPLKGMNLAYIDIADTMLRDISCLIRMDLEHVNLAGTRVFNFMALNRKPIRVLHVSRTQFKDLSMLRTMPLEELGIANTKVSSFISLKGMQLKNLDLSDTQIKDLSVLLGMPLKNLALRNVRVSDYGVLRGMNLERCDLSGSSIKDISVMEGESLTHLDVSKTEVADLSPVRKMPNLRSLNVARAKISSFESLAGCNLSSLSCQGYPIQALRPIVQMASLKDLWMDRIYDDSVYRALERIPGIERVNGEHLNAGVPVRDFDRRPIRPNR